MDKKEYHLCLSIEDRNAKKNNIRDDLVHTQFLEAYFV